MKHVPRMSINHTQSSGHERGDFMYEVQIVCKKNELIQSSWQQDVDQHTAKLAAIKNYQEKYEANRHWQQRYNTFDCLLMESIYKIEHII